jgi:hypothetical protein
MQSTSWKSVLHLLPGSARREALTVVELADAIGYARLTTPASRKHRVVTNDVAGNRKVEGFEPTQPSSHLDYMHIGLGTPTSETQQYYFHQQAIRHYFTYTTADNIGPAVKQPWILRPTILGDVRHVDIILPKACACGCLLLTSVSMAVAV